MRTRCVLTCLLLAPLLHAQFTNQGNIVSVSGDAEIKVIPNEVVLALGVETRDRDLIAARQRNDDAVRSVLAAIHGLQIDPTDVQTDFIHVTIHYSPRHRPSSITIL